MSFISRFFTNELPSTQHQQYLDPAQDEIVKYSDQINGTRQNSVPATMKINDEVELELQRPPYLHVSANPPGARPY